MVGVITSSRCDNCRKRKKKCGEQRPSCNECIRAGWSCPGYKTDWKFVDETSKLTKYYLRRKYVYDAIDLDSEEAESTFVDEDSTLDGIEVVWKTFHILNSSKSTVPQCLENSRLGSALVYCLDSKVKGALIPLRIVGSFFEFIPSRLGRNTALDDAVSCICAIYCGNPATPYNMHMEVYKSYVKALSSLRTCLDDDATRMESETLCASILLQMCELVVNVDIGEWSQLARGTAYLLYSRGVQRYTSDFDHALLESQLTYVLGQSLKYREHCFLCYPEWQNLLAQKSKWPFQSSQPQTLSLRTLLATIIVGFPSLIIDCSVLVESQTYQPGWEERLELLIQRAVSMLTNVTNWLHLKAEPCFMSKTSTYCPPTMDHEGGQINYPDVLIGVLDCVANTAILAIERLLRRLYLARPQPCSNFMGPSWPKERGLPWLSDDPEQTKPRCRRAISALDFVKAQSTLAAKPLEFGLQQVRSADSGLGG